MKEIRLDDLHGGPIHYLGNRNLSLPNIAGKMKIDRSWLLEQFEIIFANNQYEKYTRCIEPFAGSASWTLAAMEIGLAEEYIINDSDDVLINLHKLIKDKPEQVNEVYANLCKEYEKTSMKEDFYNEVIQNYNESDHDDRAKLLPFIINHSWSGIIFHDAKKHIINHKKLSGNDKNNKFLFQASLNLREFCQEIDWVSELFNKNKVHFYSGDFQNVTHDVSATDFVMLNPPYPENERSQKDKTSMYTELYTPEELHQNVKKLIQELEEKKAHYIMTYGFYNRKMQDFVIRDQNNQLRNHFRILGYDDCAFGMALDQMYYPADFSIPEKFINKLIPAYKLINNSLLSEEEALQKFLQLSHNAY